MRVSVTLFVPSLIPTGRTVTFLCDLGQFLILPVPPFIWSRAPRWPLSCYLMYLCDSCMFFHYILRAFPFSAPFFLVHLFPFLSPYIESIWSSISSVFSDVFASPMWTELNDVRAPSLRCLAKKLTEIALGSRADSTTFNYLNGFKRWRAWANRFPERFFIPDQCSPGF